MKDREKKWSRARWCCESRDWYHMKDREKKCSRAWWCCESRDWYHMKDREKKWSRAWWWVCKLVDVTASAVVRQRKTVHMAENIENTE